MCENPKLLLPLLIFFTTICSCNNSSQKATTKHYSEEVLTGFAKIFELQKNRDTGIYLIDSLYKTFPAVSAADEYRYYDFKREVFETTRYNDHSYDTAIAYTDSMIAVIVKNGLEKEMSKEYIKAFAIRGNYFTIRQRYKDAILDITRCKQLNGQIGDSCLMAENIKTLSSIAIKQSNFPLAVSLLKEALALVGACKNEQELFVRMQRYLDDLGFIYSATKEYDSSVVYHLAAAKYVLENKHIMRKDTLFPYIALENIYGNTGLIYLKKNNYNEAEVYIKKAIMVNENILHDEIGLAKLQYSLGWVYFRNGRINEAEAMAQKASAKINDFEVIFRSDLLELKANIAKSKKQYKEAAEYQELFRLTRDTIFKERINLLKKNPFVEYEQLDKKYQVELLKKDNLNQHNKTNAAIASGILITLLAIISLYFLWRIRTVMKKRTVVYNKLVESERELKETMLQKEAAEKALREKELFSQEMQLQIKFNDAIIQQRRKISDDMHDELSSSLAALKFYIEDMKNRAVGTEARNSLSDIAEEVSSVYQNARNYMHSLKTNNWEAQFNIIGFLKEIQQKFSEKGLMKVYLEMDKNGIKTRLGTYQHDQLYHIVRESISNIIKHASATEIIIAVLFNSDNCTFCISDNGKGFKEDEVTYGIGIQSIKNRVDDLDGTVIFESLPTGTKIIGSFPVYR